jgi:hypothetical protein
VAELDGLWGVKRVGGALPPLVGVRKEISGTSGSTKIGPLACMPFDVVGQSLRYRPPFQAFVDVLEPAGDEFHGSATFRGREFGKFEMRRIQPWEVFEMASEQVKVQLVKHIDEAYAMEQNVLRMLDGMIKTTDDPEIKEELRHHKLETERHAERMKERLEAHSATPSMVKEAGGIAAALMRASSTSRAGRARAATRVTATRRSTWRSRAISSSSGSHSRPATRRPPKPRARIVRTKRRWRRSSKRTGTSSRSCR